MLWYSILNKIRSHLCFNCPAKLSWFLDKFCKFILRSIKLHFHIGISALALSSVLTNCPCTCANVGTRLWCNNFVIKAILDVILCNFLLHHNLVTKFAKVQSQFVNNKDKARSEESVLNSNLVEYKKNIQNLSRNHENVAEQLKHKYGVIVFRTLYHNAYLEQLTRIYFKRIFEHQCTGSFLDLL